ncbi:ATP-grasp domain-containing protein [Mammaliicoccus sp. P-M57]|uniref:ATP-grasp domain-containing protein n=1 Tax=Mammaliicoccus sp. P-M57 TaxID=2898716 RepID=UPI001EFA2DB6|nr:ATP-grasp domain-containing protein [Mammaliicoccus sp. P-M57]
MKKILILGGSILQVPIIKKAKEMDLEVIVADYDQNAVGFKYADKIYIASTNDQEKIEDIVSVENPLAVITAATDSPMKIIANIGEKYNLKTISYDAAVKSTDKYKMRSTFEMHNVPIPKYLLIENEDDYINRIDEIKGNKIVKPIDSSGSRGIILVKENDNNLDNYYYAKSNSKSGNVLIEEQLVGNEISVESITIDNITHIIAITQKVTTGAPHFIEMGHYINANLDKETEEKIIDITKKAICSLGISQGPSHTEIMLTNDGPKIIEVGARLGGDFISSHLVKYATEIDLLKLHILQSIGEDIQSNFIKKPGGAAIKYFTSRKGLLKRVYIPKKIKNMKGFKEVKLTKEVNTHIEDIISSNSRIGYIICDGKTGIDAFESCENIINKIEIDIE